MNHVKRKRRTEKSKRMSRVRWKKWSKPVAFVLAVCLILGLMMSSETDVAAKEFDTAADNSTFESWRQYLTDENGNYSTENIGRIWTDKTVSDGDFTFQEGPLQGETISSGDSDFLIALSALSSTSNLSSTSVTPLDIVLVLDRSGSMNYGLTPVYADDLDTSRTYIIDGTGGENYTVQYQNGRWQYRDGRDWRPATPTTSASDTTRGRVQFYSDTRADGLKTAVCRFIDQTASQNADIAEAENQHQISIVSFASGTSVDQELTLCTTANSQSLKDTVNDLSFTGATRADYGMASAQRAFANTRESAKKVIIFFTDGEPTSSSSFSGEVANNAIRTAKTLKDEETTIYSIGVYEDADPADTRINFNAYMHGVSSNYPNATEYTQLGSRAENSDYYKAATNAEELNRIFEEIAEEIESGTGLPTEVTQEGFHNSGYITFTDRLGDYMQVDEFKDIAYHNVIYSLDRENGVSVDGGVTTYTFTAEVNANNTANEEKTNLSNIIITVTRSDDLETGDLVEVSIPASLIPLREFNVDLDESTMSVSESYPIRIFYGVSVKDGVVEDITDENGKVTQEAAIKSPDADLQAYINANKITDEDGNVSVAFYSNEWSGGEDGDTTAVFTPAQTNRFYYFAQNTPVYKDENCTQRMTRSDIIDPNASYYYVREYYTGDADGNAALQTKISTFPGANFALGEDNYDYDADGNLYIAPKAHRVSTINNMKTDKAALGENEANITGTAKTVINPVWTSDEYGEDISVALGNNGVLMAELPGALSISKTVRADSGLDADQFQNKEFDFTITLEDADGAALEGSFQADVTANNQTVEGSITEISTDSSGTATVQLKAGETLHIYGLDSGVQYTVAETGEDGFTSSVGDTTGRRGEGVNVQGSILAGVTAEEDFVNTYSVESVTLTGEDAFKVQKNFNKWDEDSSFTFQMSSATSTDPLPGDASGMIIDNKDALLSDVGSKTGTFGDIEFTRPGTYTYSVWEVTPDEADRVPGVSYSDEAYAVVVEVTDNGNGGLVIPEEDGVLVYKLTDDEGIPLSPEEIEANGPVENNLAVFTNVYNAESTKENIYASKNYRNESDDSDVLMTEQFSFRLTAVTDNAPMPDSGNVQTDSDGRSYIDLGNIGNSIAFEIPYAAGNVAQEYTYRLTENIPEDAVRNDDGTYTLSGVTYDATEYYVVVEVGDSLVDGVNYTVATATYYKGSIAEGNEIAERDVVFNNTYKPSPVTLSVDDDTALGGTKTLSGRNMAEGETFNFTLTNTGGPEGGATIEENGETASVSEGTSGEAKEFFFGDVTFTKPGTYTFEIREDVPATDSNGMTYDRHTASVTVVVTDEDAAGEKTGELAVTSVTYNNNGANAATDSAVFNNRYTARGIYTGVTVTKTLNGRNLTAGEFSFSISGADENSRAKLGQDEVIITNSSSANAGIPSAPRTILGNLTFTQADAGKNYTFIVKEVLPADDNAELEGIQKNGVTYDASKYQVDIRVSDNGNGTLNVAGTVNGTSVNRIDFVNHYSAGTISLSTKAALSVEKILTGRDWAENEKFTFALEDQSGSTIDTLILNKPYSGNVQTGSFADIIYDHAGTYTYTVAENVPSDAEKAVGMAYSEETYIVTVVVSEDQTTGTLAIDSVTATDKDGKTVNVDNNLAFENSYEEENQNIKEVDITRQDGTFIEDADGQLAGVGDVLTYTVYWKNDAVGDDGMAAAAAVVVTDEIPEGTTLVEGSISGSGGLDADGRTIRWELGEQAANAEGTVSFQVTVDDVADGSNSEIRNKADVKIGDNNPKTTTEVVNYVPTKTVGDANVNAADTAQVGTILTYTIAYRNTESKTADITITDTLPEGLDYVEESASNAGAYDEASHRITWTVEGVEAGQEGTVSFQARVNESATTETVGNQAVIKIGENASEIKTNTTETEIPEPGSLSISKTVETEPGQNTEINQEKEFEFAVTLKDVNGNALTGEYTYSISDSEGNPVEIANNKLKSGGTITLKHGETATISGLPNGANYTVVETETAGYTAKDKEISGTISDTEGGETAAFVNTYRVSMEGGVDTTGLFEKVFTGRNWTENDVFSFTITALNGAPMPVDHEGNAVETVTVGKPENGNSAKFGFGTIKFDAVGTYVYEVSENIPETKLPGVTYAGNKATLTINVTDGKDGTLIAATPEVTNGTFTNSYDASLDYTAAGGLSITKTLNGHAMTEGQFTFKVTPNDAESAEKLGLNEGENEFTVPAAADEETVSIALASDVTFTQEDAGKTYTYTVTEVNDGRPGYTYDDTAYTVTIEVKDNDGNATLTAVTTVKGDEEKTYTYTTGQETAEVAVIPFVNEYNASTDVEGGTKASVAATKKLTGRSLVNGEFHFQVTAQKNGEAVTVAEAVNDADGSVDFGTFSYDTRSLKQAEKDGYAVRDEDGNWTVTYTASEKTDGLSENGVTATRSSFVFTVSVVDQGDGTLTATANMPEGAGFENTYSTGDPIAFNINGSKILSSAQELTPPDITGKYSFTITGEDGAPMPENTTVSNDANGNVDFGTIEFSQDIFETEEAAADDGASDETAGTVEEAEDARIRTRTFTYTVEESGAVAGVTNDVEVKTFTVTVTDNGKGLLTVASNPGALLFTFTNTYGVEPKTASVTDQISITKKLDGRDLKAGEFTFALAEGNETVAFGTNDADGKVTFDAIEYTQPGSHTYHVYEVKGEAGKGITYDDAQYTIRATVEDHSDGTLEVAYTTDAEDGIVFTNTYKASPTTVTIGASKVLNGKDLKDGEFTFQLKDQNGTVVSEAKNDANGRIIFDTVAWDKAGTYEYTVSEVNDKQDNITYDKTQYKLTVTITDDGLGYLTADLSGDTPVFTNTYTKPSGGITADAPTAKTGDQSGIALLAAVMILAVLIATEVVLIRRRRNK